MIHATGAVAKATPTTPHATRHARHLVAGVTWALFTVVGAAVPGVAWVSLLGIVILAWSSRFFAPLSALIGCALIVLYGSSGDVSYLGATFIRPETTSAALTVLAILSFGLFIGSGAGEKVRRGDVRQVSNAVWIAVALAGVLVLLARLTNGIPLLAGDAARLTSVATVAPILGLASGVLPIVVAYLPTKGSRVTVALKIVIAVLVLATASRLLLAAVLFGFVIRSEFFTRARGFRGRALIALAIAAVTLAVLRVYSIRTDEAIVEGMASRTLGIEGVAGLLTAAIGPSLFFGSRNGLVVYELSEYSALAPPGGFILGGIANALSLGNDPERWLTQALGLDLLTTGAVATPIWAGALLDFGLVGAAVFALTAGFAIGIWLRHTPELTPWLSFGIVLSAYGSYLVSAQFVASSIVLTVLLAVWGRAPAAGATT